MFSLFLLFQNTNQKIIEATQNANSTTDQIVNASQAASQTVTEMLVGFWGRLPLIGVGVVVFIIFLGLAYVARKIITLATKKAKLDVMISSLLSRIGYFIIVILGIFVAATVIFPGVNAGDLFAGLGIGSVALGFAFKDVLQNLFAGFLILLYRPFHIGDQIKVKEYEGTIEDINVRATKMKTYDGERVVIPNSDLYMNAVIVRTAYSSRRTKIIVGIGYDEDIDKARRVMMNVLKRTEGVLENPAPDVDVVELADSSVNMRALFWSSPVQTNVRKTTDKVIGGIKKAFDAEGIEIPFPQRVLQFTDDRIRVQTNLESEKA